jgi:hypothetical protein
LAPVYRGVRLIDRHIRVASLEAFVQPFDARCEFLEFVGHVGRSRVHLFR